MLQNRAIFKAENELTSDLLVDAGEGESGIGEELLEVVEMVTQLALGVLIRSDRRHPLQ